MSAIDIQAHQSQVAAFQAAQAARNAIASALSTPEQQSAEFDPVALAQSLIPAGMPITPKDVYRAHAFKTDICDRLRGFGFEPRFWVDGLLSNPEPKSRESKQAYMLKTASDFLRNTGAIVALVGDRGLGKTTIAAQIAITRLWEDYDSRTSGGPVTHRITSYRKLTAIVSRLKALYGDFGAINIEQLEGIRDHLASVELLVIDELNECADDSKHKDRILADILDRRYAAKRDSLLITNQTEAEFKQTINPSILSRLNEHGAILPCEWESYRG